ncbi:hypothetical protein KVT40_001624 [Elsinoe batatas]|uniref:Nephrocystin 3-like N-terminal domain-containing protein n=1 Tax=Elsinoe batatas TaxID=2601811 RepID=A0A8K0L703_9PEZI|nr:hypothetical protein KVT40_001624 [Elsinoe batatas]
MARRAEHSEVEGSYGAASEIRQNVHGTVTNNAGIQHNHGGLYSGTVINNYHCSYTSKPAQQDPVVSQKNCSHTTTTAEEDPMLRRRKKCMEALLYDTFESRVHGVKTALQSTCKWILERPEYRHWAGSGYNDGGPRVMWMKGKPASGKSTMTKRIDGTERTTLGMYRSLLCQLLQKLPQLQCVLDDIHLPAGDQKPRALSLLESLQDILRSALEKVHERKVIFFIDALDECDQDQVKEMIDSFRADLTTEEDELVNLSVFFSSRHYPHLEIRDSTELILEEYIDHKLPKSWQGHEIGIKEELLRRSDGVFLWVVFVIKLLENENGMGLIIKPQDRLQRLKTVPQDLAQLFKRVLSYGQAVNPKLVLCVQWVLLSRRPLTTPELYWAIHAGISLEDFKDTRTEDLKSPAMLHAMDLFILSCSKGLLEQTRGSHNIVQFIHETVREYFMYSDLAEFGFGAHHTFIGRSEQAIKLCCNAYFSFWQQREACKILPHDTRRPRMAIEELKHAMSDGSADHMGQTRTPRSRTMFTPTARSPLMIPAKEICDGNMLVYSLLDYTLHFLFEHSEAAQGHGIDQSEFLNEFDRNAWSAARFDLLPALHEDPEDNLMFFAEANLSELLRAQLARTKNLDPPVGTTSNAFQVAVASRSRACLDIMLQMISECAHTETFERTCRPVAPGQRNIAVAALMELHSVPAFAVDLTSLILRNITEDFEPTTSPSDEPIVVTIASHGATNAMRWLLSEVHVDINIRNPQLPKGYRDALSAACRARSQGVVEILLERQDLRISDLTEEDIRTLRRMRHEWAMILSKSTPCAAMATHLLCVVLKERSPEARTEVWRAVHDWAKRGELSYFDVFEISMKETAVQVFRFLLRVKLAKRHMQNSPRFPDLLVNGATMLDPKSFIRLIQASSMPSCIQRDVAWTAASSVSVVAIYYDSQYP